MAQRASVVDYAMQIARAGTSAALGLALGTAVDGAARIGFYSDTTAAAEKVAMVVGGQTGPIWTRNGSVVDVVNNGALTAASLKATGLTSGGVATITTGGLLAYSSGLLYGSNVLTVGDGTAASVVAANGAAGQSRRFDIQTNGVSRWRVAGSTAAEGGSDAGTAFAIQALNDAGTLIDTPFSITRAAAGAILLARPLSTQNGTVSLPGLTNATDTTTGWYRSGSNSWGWVGSGVERVRFQSTGGNINTRNATAIGSLSTIALTNDIFSGHGADTTDVSHSITSYAGNIASVARVLGGTGATPTATLSGQTYTIAFRGFTTTAAVTDRASIVFSAVENWGSGIAGTSVAINVTKATTTTVGTAVTFSQASTATNPSAVFSGIGSTTDTTDSTSITTGSWVLAGGLGVAKRICLDGGTGKTLRITNINANAAVAVTLGSTGCTGTTAGAPQGWMRIDINGTDRFMPFW